MKRPELQSDILDAIALLTNRTPGDVHYQIMDGKFKELAIDALLAFSRDYHMMDRKEDSEPVDDITILQRCLKDLKSELEVTTDLTEVANIKADIDNINQRIRIAKS
jgi:hypothetical protein